MEGWACAPLCTGDSSRQGCVPTTAQHSPQHREAAGQCYWVDETRVNTTGRDRVCLTPVSPARSTGRGMEKMLNGRYVKRMRPKVKSLRHFRTEPTGEKSVGSLARAGKDLGNKLEERGFDKAYHVVLGQFLLLKKDEELFQEWLKDTCPASAKREGTLMLEGGG
uniref:Barrier-to-autointegration factor n=1 Tax=Moschus moschiferus TaxID=68415 RepID=A0A8C6CYM8_MOSMO